MYACMYVCVCVWSGMVASILASSMLIHVHTYARHACTHRGQRCWVAGWYMYAAVHACAHARPLRYPGTGSSPGRCASDHGRDSKHPERQGSQRRCHVKKPCRDKRWEPERPAYVYVFIHTAFKQNTHTNIWMKGASVLRNRAGTSCGRYTRVYIVPASSPHRSSASATIYM